MKIAVLQTAPRLLRRDENLADLRRRLARLSADVVVLPELCSSGYNFVSRAEVKRVAERAFDGPFSQLLADDARQRRRALVAGFAETDGRRFFNSALFVTPTERRVYRKVHLFWNEKRWFAPGADPFPVYRWKGARIGVMICFDWLFPEAARSLALAGAHVIAHPSNLVLPYGPEGMRTRSLENRVFSATANRVGEERGLRFIGCSQILGPRGEVLGRLGRRAAGSLVRETDLTRAASKRITPQNDLLRDRRPQLYRADR